MDLPALQAQVRALLAGLEHPRLGVALALGEECGEILRCVLDQEVYGKEAGAALAAEVGDALVALVELCERFGLDLDACARAALAKVERLAPAWRADLGPHLARLRARLDGPPSVS